MLAVVTQIAASAGQSEKFHYTLFLETTDCFAAHVANTEARAAVVRLIGKEMHIAPQVLDHYLLNYVPKHLVAEKFFVVGRANMHRLAQSARKGQDPGTFATTRHTLRLMEAVGKTIMMSEPALLVGETATGKTTIIQQLARIVGQKLTVVNLSQQSESGDLLGGFKPVSVRSLALPVMEEFKELFGASLSRTKNRPFLDKVEQCAAKNQWRRAVKLWESSLAQAEALYGSLTDMNPSTTEDDPSDTSHQQKRRKVEPSRKERLRQRWGQFASKVQMLHAQTSEASKSFAFKFVEGNIVKAVRNGEWVLLDEINLASPDTLEHIADLLSSGSGRIPSLLLAETGDMERIKAHPNFRLFAAMNPATDIGKRDLAVGLRSRFTEIYVESPDRDLNDLKAMIQIYLRRLQPTDDRLVHDVAELYLEVRRLADSNRLVDGAGQKPHFSLRTLTRTLTYAVDITSLYGLTRSLYEGFLMSFSTLLDSTSESLVLPLIDKHLLGKQKNARSLLSQVARLPADGQGYVQFEHYWMLKGQHPIEPQPH